MSEHLPEPWRTDDAAGFPGDVMAGTEMVARTVICGVGHGIAHANARRIVACVNALEGLNDEALIGGWSFRGIEAYAKGIEQQRDGLLVAMKNILWNRTPGDRRHPSEILKEIEAMARDAVAKAKT